MLAISFTEQKYVDLKHRSKADIAAVILEAAVSGAVIKSKIYYRSYLTYSRLKGYMKLLIENRLIECFDYEDNTVYRTTDKGTSFLRAYKDIRELIG